MKVLLVEPEFPVYSRRKIREDYLPVGLLKLANYHKSRNDFVKLARGNLPYEQLNFEPDQIMITSLFTYWRKYVKESVEHYRSLFPRSRIVVGGIYASLMSKDCKEYTGCDEVFVGIHEEAEESMPDYDLIANPHTLGYQVIHSSRGCIRNCPFCGVSRVEPRFTFKKSIKNEIRSNRLIFYDNNILANPHIKNILKEIAVIKHESRPISCESQCGFDGRLLTREIAELIKKARFRNVRIAWDGPYSESNGIKKQIDLLTDVGYKSKDIFVFMIYNWEIDFDEMEKKRKKCREWNVQIADCRYRPLNQTADNYSPFKKQTSEDYFIHPKWTDHLVKRFRRNVRRQNICVRMGFESYDLDKEREGAQERKVRNELPLLLEARGYPHARVTRVKRAKHGWIAYFKTASVDYRLNVSSSFNFGKPEEIGRWN